MVFIGIPEADFARVQQNVRTDKQDALVNLGYVNYKELDDLYSYVDACAVFYLSGTFNNKFCAPNRLYAALNSGKPILVNADNFVLSHAALSHNAGLPIRTPQESAQFFDRLTEYEQNAAVLKYTFERSGFTELKDYYTRVLTY
jgi:hypothetical protein